jgi:hypothetical protein
MRSSFEAIHLWIQDEWVPHGAFWIGTDAEKQWRQGLLELAAVSPGVEYRILRVNKPGGHEGKSD